MSEIKAKYDEEFKKNAVKLSYASPKTVKHVSEDLGIGENLLYRWRKKYTADGDKTAMPRRKKRGRRYSPTSKDFITPIVYKLGDDI